MKRRTFLQATVASTLATTLARSTWALPSDHKYMQSIGLQLWTVRNQMEKDVPATIKAVAEAGYKQVELMAVLDSDNILTAASDNDLKVTSAFIDWQSIANPGAGPSFDSILERAIKISLKHLVFGYIGKGLRETSDQFKGHAERANQAGEKCKQAGIQLCYHNHSFEFAKLDDGQFGWDVLVQEFDDALVKFEVDVFWVAIGGRDPLDAMKQLKGRISQVHLKDLQKGAKIQHDEGKVPNDAFKELGNGSIDMNAVIQVAVDMGAEQCHVEQDQSPNPIASIGQSIKHLGEI